MPCQLSGFILFIVQVATISRTGLQWLQEVSGHC